MSERLEEPRRRWLASDYPVAFFVRATEEEAAKIRENAAMSRRPLSRFLAEAGGPGQTGRCCLKWTGCGRRGRGRWTCSKD